MSAPLPFGFFLPALRELADFEHLATDQLAPALLANLFAYRAEMRDAIDSLGQQPLSHEAIADWSRQRIPGLFHFTQTFLPLLQAPGLVAAARDELQRQREDLVRFLRPLERHNQADWALVSLLLVTDAFPRLLELAGPLPSVEQLQAELADHLKLVDVAGPIGAPVRILGFLTLILDAARAGETPGPRHATWAALAFLEAQRYQAMMAHADPSLVFDPTPYLDGPRVDMARQALLRLGSSALPEEALSHFVLSFDD